MLEGKGVRAVLDEARRKAGECDHVGALAACDRARAIRGSSGPWVDRALEVLLRAAAEIDRQPDPATLVPAAETLAAHGEWEDAAGAYGLLARAAAGRADLEAERRYLASAVGCAEAGSSGVTLPSFPRVWLSWSFA